MDSMKKHEAYGFTLIEVMLAVLVLGIGILAVSKLQANLIRSGAEANERSVASNLVGKKMDDLRRFIHLTTSDATVPDAWSVSINNPNSLSYKHIANNAGGLMGSGTYTIGNINFDLSWQVQDYYFSSTNAKATTTPTGVDYPSYKTAHVVVKWDSVSSTNNVVSFDSVINAYDPLYTVIGGSVPAGSTGPVVPYTPQSAPDVVPITIGDDGVKKETSKPEPDLRKKGDSTSVKFETVTYTQSLDTVKREEFRTLVCKCKSGTPSSQQIYGITTWDDTLDKIIDVTTIQSKSITKTQVDASGVGQDPDCNICCRDGDVVSGTDYKVCRMKRVDGILRMFQPWKLIGFNLIPASYFNDSNGLPAMTTTLQANNISTYSQYVTSLVRGVLTAKITEPAYNSFTTVDTSFINNTNTYTNNSGVIDHLDHTTTGGLRAYQARAIYLDYPPTGIYTTEVINGTTVTYAPTNVPLDRIPFYEVNLTRLAGWIPDKENSSTSLPTGDTNFVIHYTSQHDGVIFVNPTSCPSSAVVISRNNVSNDELLEKCEQIYSRGEFDPQVTGTTTITTRIFTNSDGVIDRNVNPGNISVDSSVGLTVN